MNENEPITKLKPSEELFADCMRDVISDKGFLNYKALNDFIEELKEEIENAQEDYGNLDWVYKENALEIIDKIKLKHFGKESE